MQTMQTEARVCKQGGSAEIANNFDAGATALRLARALPQHLDQTGERVHSHKWVSKLPCRHVALHTLPACLHRRSSGQARKQQQQQHRNVSERFRGLSVDCRREQHSSLDMGLRLRLCGFCDCGVRAVFDWVFLLQIGKRTLHAMCDRARMIYDMYISSAFRCCAKTIAWIVAAV